MHYPAAYSFTNAPVLDPSETPLTGSPPGLTELWHKVQEQGHEIENIRHDLAGHQRVVNELHASLAQLLQQQRAAVEPIELTPKQEAVFRRLEAIAGNDDTARTHAEKELIELQDERATKVLVDQLKVYLREKKWGIMAEANVIAAPLWHNRLLRLIHYDENGQRRIVKSFAVIPILCLAPRTDRRSTP